MTYIGLVLGLLAGVVGIADTIPYVRDTVGGSTRPHRGTWLIWSVLAIVVCLSQRADGASWSLIMAAAQAVLTSAVFLLSIRRGEGGLSPADVLIIIPAVSLLLAKELVHYFVAGRREPAAAAATEASAVTARLATPADGSRADLKDFVRPYWEIVRDWFPFLVVLLMYYSLWGDATHLLITTDRDAALVALDQRLFHFQASVAIQRFISQFRRLARHVAHLVELAVAMQDHVATGVDDGAGPFGERSRQCIHGHVITHQQALEPNSAANHLPDDCRRSRRRLGGV